MADKIWARRVNGMAVEIVPLDATLTPGKDVFTTHLDFVDVTDVPGIAEHWVCADGVWSPPPAPPAPTVATLLDHAKAKRETLAAAGKTIDVAVSGAPSKLVFASTDAARLGELRDACDYAQATASPTFWSSKGTIVQLSPAEMVNLKLGIQGFAQKTRGALALVTAAIEAGTITTVAAIDAATSWPVAG